MTSLQAAGIEKTLKVRAKLHYLWALPHSIQCSWDSKALVVASGKDLRHLPPKTTPCTLQLSLVSVAVPLKGFATHHVGVPQPHIRSFEPRLRSNEP